MGLLASRLDSRRHPLGPHCQAVAKRRPFAASMGFPTARAPAPPGMGSAHEDPCPPVLPNGSALVRPLPQVLEAQQHDEHPFGLAVEMDLVAAKAFPLVEVERLAERLLEDQGRVRRLLLPAHEPWQVPTSFV
jgi:hypothetical protein